MAQLRRLTEPGGPPGHLTAEERNVLKAAVDGATRENLGREECERKAADEHLFTDEAAQQERDRQLDLESDTSEADYWAERIRSLGLFDDETPR